MGLVTAFKLAARARQASFRSALSADAQRVIDPPWSSYKYFLVLGHEEETLYPTLRGPSGAIDYFKVREAKWWKSTEYGDSELEGPTRNMTSSQVALVNLLLPFKERPDLLAAMLRVIDPEVVSIAPIDYSGPTGPMSSFVELEWTGTGATLEGRGSRGAHATSADAFLIGVTSRGERRAFLLECKYSEFYREDDKGFGTRGSDRRALYTPLYTDPASAFSQIATFDDVLYEPFYQIVRLGLLGDMMCRDASLRLSDSRVAVICPTQNSAYRDRVTSPALRARFPDSTVAEIARKLWKKPENFTMIDPSALVDAVRAASVDSSTSAWCRYMQARYGW